MALVPVEDVLLWSVAQAGDRYVFGAEVPLSASDSDEWDCSELIEWACGKAGVAPRVPDGAYYQWQHCKKAGLLIPVEQGIATRGAQLFVGDGTGVGRDAITHTALSLGDGTTIEARGSRWGVGSWPSAGRFDFAGLIPGIAYHPILEEDDDVDEATLNRVLDAKLHLHREWIRAELGTGVDDAGNPAPGTRSLYGRLRVNGDLLRDSIVRKIDELRAILGR